MDLSTVHFNLRKKHSRIFRNLVLAIGFSHSQFFSAIMLLIEQREEAEIDSYVINDLVLTAVRGFFCTIKAPVCLLLLPLMIDSEMQKSIVVIAKDLSISLATQSHFSSVAVQHNQHRHLKS